MIININGRRADGPAAWPTWRMGPATGSRARGATTFSHLAPAGRAAGRTGNHRPTDARPGAAIARSRSQPRVHARARRHTFLAGQILYYYYYYIYLRYFFIVLGNTGARSRPRRECTYIMYVCECVDVCVCLGVCVCVYARAERVCVCVCARDDVTSALYYIVVRGTRVEGRRRRRRRKITWKSVRGAVARTI